MTAAHDLLTKDDLAKGLGVPAATISKWRYNGDGPRGIRLGRHLRFRREDVDRWLEARADRPG